MKTSGFPEEVTLPFILEKDWINFILKIADTLLLFPTSEIFLHDITFWGDMYFVLPLSQFYETYLFASHTVLFSFWMTGEACRLYGETQFIRSRCHNYFCSGNAIYLIFYLMDFFEMICRTCCHEVDLAISSFFYFINERGIRPWVEIVF